MLFSANFAKHLLKGRVSALKPSTTQLDQPLLSFTGLQPADHFNTWP